MTKITGNLDQRQLNVAVLTIAKRLMPCGFDVGPDAPDTLEGIKANYALTGRIKVWDGASEQTIYGDREVNYAFRAWHDWCHLRGNHEFDDEGELAVAVMQCSHVQEVYGLGPTASAICRVIMAEVVGLARYRRDHGEFPVDQRTFVLGHLSAQGVV